MPDTQGSPPGRPHRRDEGRDEVRTRTLRMALTSVSNEEVAGKAARELSDDEVLKILAREAKRRREAAAAFAGGRAGTSRRPPSGPRTRSWPVTCPAQLDDAELAGLVAAAIAETGASGPPAMGQVMKAVTPQVAGRAEGSRVAAEVRRQLGRLGPRRGRPRPGVRRFVARAWPPPAPPPCTAAAGAPPLPAAGCLGRSSWAAPAS